MREADLKRQFKELHLKCVDETKKLGNATYDTHGKRCEALGKLLGFQEGKKQFKTEAIFLKKRIEELKEIIRKMEIRRREDERRKIR